MEVWVAVISYEHGTDLYAARTEAKLFEQLAKYCRSWWEDTDIAEEPPPDDNHACVMVYFQHCTKNETLELTSVDLED